MKWIVLLLIIAGVAGYFTKPAESVMRESADAVFSIVDVNDFSEGNYRELAAIVDQARSSVGQSDIRDYVVNTATRVGRPPTPFLANVLTCGIMGTPEYWARKVRDDALRAAFVVVCRRGLQRATETESIADAITAAQADMNLLNIPPFYQYVARGCILLAAVLLDRIKHRD